MAIEMGHKFHHEHGFTGSAGKAARPKIPGYRHGGMDEKIKEAVHEHEDQEHGGHHSRLHLKKGGLDRKDHHGKKSHIDHDGAMHKSHVHYDEDGYQHHKKGGMC